MYVCDEAEVTCNQCGTAGVTGPGQWLTVPCRPATVGSIVKLVKPDSHLQLCEIEIFGVTAAGIHYHDTVAVIIVRTLRCSEFFPQKPPLINKTDKQKGCIIQ